MSFSTIFKNGGENYSFGRSAAGFVIFVGMITLCYGVIMDYYSPVLPVTIQCFDLETKTAYTITDFVAKPDWSGYQTFMTGIAMLAGSVYGLSKFGAAAQTVANNGGPANKS